MLLHPAVTGRSSFRRSPHIPRSVACVQCVLLRKWLLFVEPEEMRKFRLVGLGRQPAQEVRYILLSFSYFYPFIINFIFYVVVSIHLLPLCGWKKKSFLHRERVIGSSIYLNIYRKREFRECIRVFKNSRQVFFPFFFLEEKNNDGTYLGAEL